MPLVTLSSDIGKKDYLVAAIKGRFWKISSQFQFADITHEIPPFEFNEAAYLIRNAVEHFSDFTWHIILLDLYYAPNPKFLLAFHNNQYFICPDNGLLPMILNTNPTDVIQLPFSLQSAEHFALWNDQIAALILRIESGESLLKNGTEAENILVLNNLKAAYGPDWIEGSVLIIDRYENVIFNITKSEFERIGMNRKFEIQFVNNEKITKISKHYGSEPESEKLAFFNAAGYLEIAINKGNAAGLFGFRSPNKNESSSLSKARNIYHKLRIIFEQAP